MKLPKHWQRTALAAFFSAAFLGCSEKRTDVARPPVIQQPVKTRVEGSVFIVTKGRANIKMGLVPIFLMNEAEMSAFTNRVEKLLLELKLEHQQQIKTIRDQATKNLQEQKKLEDYAIKLEAYHDAQVQSVSRASPSQRDTLIDQANRTVELHSSAVAKIDALTRDQTVLSVKSQKVRTEWKEKQLEFCFSALKYYPATAKTDADGKFDFIATGKERFFVLAMSERKALGDDDEHYFWITDFIADGKPVKLMLHNDNLLTVYVNPLPKIDLDPEFANARATR
jgi:hypothetical protein